MTITVKKEVEEELEVKTPSYYESYGSYSRITEKGIVKILPLTDSIIKENKEKAVDIIRNGKEITEEQFLEKFHEVSEKINTLAGISNVPTLNLQTA